MNRVSSQSYRKSRFYTEKVKFKAVKKSLHYFTSVQSLLMALQVNDGGKRFSLKIVTAEK